MAIIGKGKDRHFYTGSPITSKFVYRHVIGTYKTKATALKEYKIFERLCKQWNTEPRDKKLHEKQVAKLEKITGGYRLVILHRYGE